MMVEVSEENEKTPPPTQEGSWTSMIDMFSNAVQDCLKEEMNFLQEELSQGDKYMNSSSKTKTSSATTKDEGRDQEEPELLTDDDAFPRESEQVSLLPSLGTALTFDMDEADDDGRKLAKIMTFSVKEMTIVQIS